MTGLVLSQYELCGPVWSGLWSVRGDDGTGRHGNVPHRFLLQPQKVGFLTIQNTDLIYWRLLTAVTMTKRLKLLRSQLTHLLECGILTAPTTTTGEREDGSSITSTHSLLSLNSSRYRERGQSGGAEPPKVGK